MPGFESLSVGVVLWIALVIVLAALVQGALGLGFPIVATPLIALVTDMKSAVVVVLLPCVAAILVNIVKGGPLRPLLAEFWMMPLYAFAGAAAGTWLFIAFPHFPFAVLLAAVILVYLNLDRLGRAEWPAIRRHKALSGALFGTLAGISEGTANAAAPPLVIYYLALGLTPGSLVQALNICFITGKATQFFTLATSGGVTSAQWLATLPFAAVAGVGVLCGIRIRGRVAAATYRHWLRRALFAVALVLLAQYVYTAGF
ncbi:MAG: TSUP family transporter [Burkholderiales bacterium]